MLDRVKECEDYDPDDNMSGLLSLDYGGSIINMCLFSRAMDAKEKAKFILEFHKFCLELYGDSAVYEYYQTEPFIGVLHDNIKSDDDLVEIYKSLIKMNDDFPNDRLIVMMIKAAFQSKKNFVDFLRKNNLDKTLQLLKEVLKQEPRYSSRSTPLSFFKSSSSSKSRSSSPEINIGSHGDILVNFPMKDFLKSIPPLHQAVVNGDLDAIARLEKTPEEHKPDIYGMTPILYAALLGKKKLVMRFLRPTADRTKQDTPGIGRAMVAYEHVSPDGFSLADIADAYGLYKTKEYLDNRKKWGQKVLPGFHQTDKNVAQLILQQVRSGFHGFLAGSGGMLGPGIYFATSIEDTSKKALSKGDVFECDVRMGNPLLVQSHNDIKELQNEIMEIMGIGLKMKTNTTVIMSADVMYDWFSSRGYHSIYGKQNPNQRFLQTGDEFVVFNPEQVIPKLLHNMDNNKVEKIQMGGARSSSKANNKLPLVPHWLSLVRSNDVATLKRHPRILEEGGSGFFSTTPLMIAAVHGLDTLFQWLMRHPRATEWLSATDDLGRSTLFYAMRGGSAPIVRSIIANKGINVLAQDANGRYASEYFRSLDHDTGRPYSETYRTVLINALYKLAEDNARAIPAILAYHRYSMVLSPEHHKKLGTLRIQHAAHLPVDKKLAMDILLQHKDKAGTSTSSRRTVRKGTKSAPIGATLQSLSEQTRKTKSAPGSSQLVQIQPKTVSRKISRAKVPIGLALASTQIA